MTAAPTTDSELDQDVRFEPIPDSPQERALASSADITLFGGANGGGKGQPLSGIVWTPWGEKKMGDIEVGDSVLSGGGQACDVLQIHELGVREIYRVEFCDGSYLDVTDDHLWLAWKAQNCKQRGKDSRLWRTDQLEPGMRIPLCGPMRFTPADRWWSRRIPAYDMGVLLGDGSFRSGDNFVGVSVHEREIFKKLSVETKPRDSRTRNGEFGGDFKVIGCTDEIRRLGLNNLKSHEKFIPKVYKRRPVQDRCALLTGLLDADGTVSEDGKIRFCSTSERLANDVQWLIESMGGYASKWTRENPTYTGSDGEKKSGRPAHRLHIKLPDASRYFTVERKASRCREFQSYSRKVESVESVAKEGARCISVSDPSGLYLAGDRPVVTHNTAALVAAAGRGVYARDPHWTAAVFRRTYPELDQPDGVIDQSKDFYPGPDQHYNASKSRWSFPSGAQVDFSHLQHEKSKKRWDGAQLTFIGFDQLEAFTQSQFFYLLGRARSPHSQFDPHIFATCNPPEGKDHWLYQVARSGGWVDEDGMPDHEAAGELQYFHRDGDEIRWAAGPDDLSAAGDEPMSMTMIPATVEDNPYLGDDYERFLNSLGEADRQRKRIGRWGVKRSDSPLEGHSIQFVDSVPDDAGIAVRYWDLADTDASADTADSASHTAGVRAAGLTRQWTLCQYADQSSSESCSYWCAGEPEGEQCPKCGHEQLDTRQRDVLVVSDPVWFQLAGGDKENRITAVASRDGQDVHVGIEQEGGQSGKDVIRKWRDRLLSDHTVEGDRPTGDKQDRMDLWRPLAEQGRLWVVEGPRSTDFVAALVDADPQDCRDALSGAAKMALDDDRVDGPDEVVIRTISY